MRLLEEDADQENALEGLDSRQGLKSWRKRRMFQEKSLVWEKSRIIRVASFMLIHIVLLDLKPLQ